MAHKVVIIGGGFGGLYAAKSFAQADLQVTVLDRRNFHLFQPLLYQVATGALSPGDIASPLRSILRKQKNTVVLLGEALDVDVDTRTIRLDDGTRLAYDTLIVAAGAQNHYFGNSAWEQFAPGLKTVEEATHIRQRILYAFEAAEREPDPEQRRAWLTFVVVGAGPTGVELAGALGEIANDTLKEDFRFIRPEEARILLLDGSPRVLPPFPPDLSEKAERSLIKLGVRTRTNVKVTNIDPGGVTLTGPKGEEQIASRTVLWAAGVQGASFGRRLAERTGAELDRGGRIVVASDCSIPNHPNILVIGDLAHCKGKDGTPLPGVAPTAMQQGRYAARLVQDRIAGKATPPFHYRNKGSLAVIGRASGVAQLGGLHFSGLTAWLLWLFVHLMYLAGFQNRLVVFVRWGFTYITFNRGARLITKTEL
ncbi:MAG TPA: NAD(P)/FAD-dependent oxidoreductase [Bryobacteraceae bacterium]|nr:NAD(P)/FAD-dependent oxidoreductase [Bryobacteraceae bacterium]